MQKFLRRSAKTFAVLVVIVSCAWLAFKVVRADVQSGWLSIADPAIEKTVDLPANQSPALSNRDCTQLTYNTTAGTTANDCFVQTALGSMGSYGTPILFNNSSLGLPVQGFQGNNFLLQPVPNQAMVVSTSSSSVIGSYVHFYTDLRQDITANHTNGIGAINSYTVNKPPDFSLRDKNAKLIPANTYGALAYSSNGSWMIVDAPWKGFLRVNLATMDVLPFAPSLNGANDYSTRYGEIAISDDGRYAAIASDQYSYFRIYDLSTCSGTIPDDYNHPIACQSRDYWPFISSHINGFKAIYSVRFTNDANISVTATYNAVQSNSSFSAATFNLTAPGKASHALDYMALGDSYISGQGEFIYKNGTDTATNSCHLSPLSYPFTIGSGLFNAYQSIACSGALVDDVIDESSTYKGQVKDNIQKKDRQLDPIYNSFDPGYLPQLDFVKKYHPEVVTISLGGNDIGFSDVLKSCALPNFSSIPMIVDSSTCYDTYDERMQVVQAIGTVFSNLQTAYRAIQENDPGVRLYVIGYPQVAVQGSCGDDVRLNTDEIQFSQELIAYIDWTIERAANSVGARYVDTQNALAGSRLCEAKTSSLALNGLTAGNDAGPFGTKIIGSESFHPNVLGHQMIGRAILGQTNNLKQAMPVADLSIDRPHPTDPLAQILLGSLQPSNRALPQTVATDDSMTSDMITRGSNMQVNVTGIMHGLAPNSQYQAVLDSNSTSLSTVTSSTVGDLSLQVPVSVDTPAGFHTLHVTGKNMAEQTVDIYKVIYVAASATDFDGDGVPNSANQCLVVPLSGRDVDQDGIDDACDPLIGDPPAINYSARVTLTGNTIQITNSR